MRTLLRRLDGLHKLSKWLGISAPNKSSNSRIGAHGHFPSKMVQNRGFVFEKIPQGLPVAGQDLIVKDSSLDLEKVPSGGLVLQNWYASFDPYQRGRMRDSSIKSYSPAFDLGKCVMSSRVIAKVVATDTASFQKGDLVMWPGPTEEYTAVDAETLQQVQKVNNPHQLDPALFLGPLGMPGLTAYSSFYAIGKPKRGETIYISAASGAVGQIVGQLAAHEGMTVVGSVGDDKKLEFITKELGFHAGFNYKKEKPIDALNRIAPNGIDIYYDNVGGEQLEAAIETMNNRGRIVCCGMISGYNQAPDQRYGVKNLMQFVAKRLTMSGFIVGDADMGPIYAQEHIKNVSQWIKDGTFKVKLSLTDGIENAPAGFIGMLEGHNFGKAVLKIANLE